MRLFQLIKRSSSIVVSMSETFLYFGYGSNLLKERLRLLNPSAVFVSTGKLTDFMLDFEFGHPKSRWAGSAATVTEQPGSHVWGVVWRMSRADLPNIDKQEGVAEGVYRPIEVQVETPSGESLNCRSYQLLMTSGDRLPSPQYMDVLARGAKQNSLPQEYVEFLQNIKTNGHQGHVKIYEEVLKSLEQP